MNLDVMAAKLAHSRYVVFLCIRSGKSLWVTFKFGGIFLEKLCLIPSVSLLLPSGETIPASGLS